MIETRFSEVVCDIGVVGFDLKLVDSMPGTLINTSIFLSCQIMIASIGNAAKSDSVDVIRWLSLPPILKLTNSGSYTDLMCLKALFCSGIVVVA